MRCRLWNNVIVVFLLFAILALPACRGKSYARMEAPMPVPMGWSPAEPSTAVIHTAEGGTSFSIELADTPEERERGLMFRDYLDPSSGMLFVFPRAGNVTFWMKDTRIPLDMIFIDADMTITNIAEARPCEADPCPTYSSDGDVQYVLEINAGLAREKNIKEGDSVSLLAAY